MTTPPKAHVTLHSRILDHLRAFPAPGRSLTPVLRSENVTWEKREDGEYNAVLTADFDQLLQIEALLVNLRHLSCWMGYTRARNEFGFDRWSLDAALNDTLGAQWELSPEAAA